MVALIFYFTNSSPLLLFFRFEVQCDGVDAIAHAGCLSWAVIEEVAKVRSAILAYDFGARHEERTVLVQFDVFSIHRLVEAGPAGTGVKFGIRGKERLAAGDTLVHALLVIVIQCAGEGPLRSFQTTDLVLLRGQLLFPVRLGLIS